MKRSVDFYISELLYIHDCVIIPGFGGFVGNHTSAKLDQHNHTLSPPSKQLLFNQNLKTNDGLLINYIMDHESLDVKKIENEIKKFIENAWEKLNQIKKFRLNKIGLFSLEKEGNLVFIQDEEINYSLEAYGMPKIKASNFSRNIIKKELKKDIPSLRIKDKKIIYRKTWRAAAVLIPLIGISLISINKQTEITNIYAQMAKLNIFNYKAAKHIIPIEKTAPTLEEIEATTLSNEITPATSDKIILPKKVQYHIIAGAFSNEKNAANLIAELNKKNYRATIIGKNKTGLIRVAYASYVTKTDALVDLATIRENNRSAWILSQ